MQERMMPHMMPCIASFRLLITSRFAARFAVLACVAYFHAMSAQQAAAGGAWQFRAVLVTEDKGLRLKVKQMFLGVLRCAHIQVKREMGMSSNRCMST
jgi:hypothetical protein